MSPLLLRSVLYIDKQLLLNNDHITLRGRQCAKHVSLISLNATKCDFLSQVQI